jgi:MYXO-CTERM domain-containing protein
LGPFFQFFLGSQALGLNSYAGGERFSEAVFNGKSLADFGITTSGLLGTWTLQPADGSDLYTANDTINLIAGSSSAAVPGPLPLLGAGAAFGWSRRLRKRIAAPLSTPPQA